MSGSLNGTPGAQGYLVSDLIALALRQIGVGALGTMAGPQDLADGVMHLNMLLAQWQRRTWLVPNLVDMAFMSNGRSSYLIGPGGDLDLPVRPDKIEGAYARLLNGAPQSIVGEFSSTGFDNEFLITEDGLNSASQPIDYTLALIPSYEDYTAIGLKALRSWPSCCHYNPEFPMGALRVWPIPQEGIWEIHIVFKAQLPANLQPSDTLNLPPEYWDALMWTLAARLAPSYGQEASPTVVANAKAALNTIRASNAQTRTLSMPSILSPVGNPFWWPGLERQKL